MKIGIPREIKDGETRVALVPSMVSELKKLNVEVLIEKSAGDLSHFSDDQYKKSGAQILPTSTKLFQESDLILKVQPPVNQEIKSLKEGITIVGVLSPILNKELTETFLAKKITSFSMEFVPRITRAQSMDVLSSMSTVAGYKAVLLATEHFSKFFPLLMTAAGTIPPASVFVLGAGVAGLQAIATAKRLGAKVEAFDVRVAVKEQIESLGARFVEMELPSENLETKGGYAKEATEEFIKKEHEAIGSRLPKTDIVISTAQVFGKKAPILIKEEMVKTMQQGSIIIDLAAEQGGNCDLTVAGKVVEKFGVKIYGPANLPALMPTHASQMYSRNVVNFIKHLYQAEDKSLDFEDEITKSSCITHNGEFVNEFVKEVFSKEGDK